jgi:hypothetical protein
MERDAEKLIMGYMGPGQLICIENEYKDGIEHLWPVLIKIRKQCEGNTIYLNHWVVIAMGLQAVNFDVVYNGVVEYIKFYNSLKN